MEGLSFQPLQLRTRCYKEWWSPARDIKSNQLQGFVTRGVSGCRGFCIKAQVSSVKQPTAVELLESGVALHGRGAAKHKISNLGEQERQWYEMINAIKTSGDAVQVLSMQNKGKNLSKETIVGTLVRLKQLRLWKSVMEVCEWLAKQDWWEFGFHDYCLLMAAYGKESQPEKAEMLLKDFRTAGHKANIAMHTGLIEAYARKRMFDKAEAAFKLLLESGPAPSVLTYHILMKAYSEDDRLEDAERIFSSMVGDMKPDGRCYNLMIHAYGKAGEVDKAFKFYQEMRALKLDISVITFNSLISKQKSLRDAESIFRQMKVAKVRPDVFSYTALMKAYGKAGKTERAQSLFEEMMFMGIRPTATTYNVLLDAYVNARQVDEAEIVLKQMRQDRCVPTIHSFTTLVRAYALVGKMEKAEEILRRMKSENVAPNVVTFSTMISGYAAAGDMRRTMKTFNKMKDLGVQPNQTVYTVLIGASGLQDDFEASKSWFKEMVASGLEADQRARNALTKASKTPDQLLEALALVDSCR